MSVNRAVKVKKHNTALEILEPYLKKRYSIDFQILQSYI